MAAETHPNNRRNATDAERILASALITGAFGIIVAVLWGASGFFDKVTHIGQLAVVWLGIIGCLLLVCSIVLGGLGIAYGIRPGAWNHFDLQAKLGFVAVIVLLSAPIIGYSLKISKPSAVDVDSKLNDLRNQVADMKATLNARLETVDQNVASNLDKTSLLRQEIDGLKARLDLIHQGAEKGKAPNKQMLKNHKNSR